MSTITIYIWIFSILCVFALLGVIAFLFMFNLMVIEPIRDYICNYKRYKNFYDEHYGDYLKWKFSDKEENEDNTEIEVEEE